MQLKNGLKLQFSIRYTHRPSMIQTAVAMTDDFSTLNANELQDVLRNNGVVFHEKEFFKNYRHLNYSPIL